MLVVTPEKFSFEEEDLGITNWGQGAGAEGGVLQLCSLRSGL